MDTSEIKHRGKTGKRVGWQRGWILIPASASSEDWVFLQVLTFNLSSMSNQI